MSESIEALTGKSREVTEKVDRNEYDDAKREFAAASEALAIAKTAYWRAERRLRNAEMARARE